MREKALVRADVEDRKPEVVSFEKNIEASYLFAGRSASAGYTAGTAREPAGGGASRFSCVGDRYCLCGRSVFARFSAFTAWRFLPSGGPYLCGDRYRYRPAREPLGAAYCVVRGAHHPFFAGGCYHARGPGSWIRRTGPSSLPLSGSRP